MAWLIFAITSYVMFAAVSLADKYLLSKARIQPALYAFSIGVLGMLTFLLIPFVGFLLPPLPQLLLSIGSGVFLIYALYWYATGVQRYEASRIIPAMGSLSALFVFFFLFLFSGGQTILSLPQFFSFFLLILGAFLITFEKGKGMNLQSMRIAFLNAFFFGLAFVMAKYVYLSQPFWSGFITMRIGGLIVALLLLIFSKEVASQVFAGNRKTAKPFWRFPRIAFVFCINQGAGASAEILKSFAIFLVPLSFLPFVSALQGVQYAVILLIAVLLSAAFPRILKEEISKSGIAQKVLAILCIVFGILILALP
ncbi:MAG: hypothetical protein HYS60_01690 [Candidatus Wildermuthbacteria bacterium]|nr:hypothetical protein [Candidatus Wildermuthbacteria bacterium]